MKKIITGLVAVVMLCLIISCTTQTTVPETLSKEWKLIELEGFTKETMIANNAGIDLSANKEAPNRYNANMGCNNMFFQAAFSPGGNVKFSQMGSTMMYCDRGMDLESAFSAALPKMNRYNIEGHYLTLSAPDGTRMKFVAADWD